MTKEKPSYKDIRAIDVSEHIEKKNNLSYLSWAWAVDTLFLHDEQASWEYPEPTIYPDGTVMVYCVVNAFGKTRKAHLPVMDYKNQAIKNPNAFQMNTAMQRCLVKAIAHHGLGLYIYAGEDLPEGPDAPKEITFEEKQFQRDFFYALSLCETVEAVEELTADAGELPGACSDAAASRIEGLGNGVKFPPPKFGFINVDEAEKFGILAKNNIEKGPIDSLDEWMTKNDHKLKALDAMLKAAKYNKDGTPSERLFRAYEQRIAKETA